MSAILETIKNGIKTEKPIKNLGWVIRNWKNVESFNFDKTLGDSYQDGELIVECSLSDGTFDKDNRRRYGRK